MILQLISPPILNFLEDIENLGFSLCLVGGIPRDFFYTKTIGRDFDFEIRPDQKTNLTLDTWPLYYKKLHHYLSDKKIPYTELPYLITRVEFLGVHFEFSSPRSEKNIPDNFSHHHFEALLDPGLSYELSFSRRDFSINAIGIELHLKKRKEKIIDPFLGMEDLKEGIIKNITDDFFLDSVRFLRLIRFKLKFEKFTIDPLLYQNLSKFNLTKLSFYHFKEELFKSRPGAFLNKFSEIVMEQQLNIPPEFQFWLNYNFPENLTTQDELLFFVFLQKAEDAQHLAHFFSMPEKRLKDLKSFFQSYEAIKHLKQTEVTQLLALPEEEALKHPILKDLKNLEEKKEWRRIYPQGLNTKLLIDWDDWGAIRINNDELLQINPAARSYYQFYKTLKMKFSHD